MECGIFIVNNIYIILITGFDLASSPDHSEWGKNHLISRREPVLNHLISIFYGSTSSPDHIVGGELVQNHLISIFYGSTSSPDHIERGEPVQKHVISILYGLTSSPDLIKGGEPVRNRFN